MQSANGIWHVARHIAAVSIARGLRDFGDGFAAVLLPVYLSALGLDAAQIGVAATLALLGSAMFTLGVGWLGTPHRRPHAR